jgi:hypothetical protein
MSNEPVPLSSFGIFTNGCAVLFCKDKDGFNLWLTLINECFYNIQQSIQFENNIKTINEKLHSPLIVGLICSFVGFVCFIISYLFTKKFLCMTDEMKNEIKMKIEK